MPSERDYLNRVATVLGLSAMAATAKTWYIRGITTSRHLRLKGRLALFWAKLVRLWAKLVRRLSKTEQAEYPKRYMSVEDLVSLLVDERGMVIADRAQAESALRRIGYYRLSGYWYPFRKQAIGDNGKPVHLSDFIPGTTIVQVLDIAEFDRQLRMRIFEGIEAVEVALRSAVADQIGRRDTFAHRYPEMLDASFQRSAQSPKRRIKSRTEHAAWLAEIKRQEDRSNEAFAKHHRQRYGGPFPVWMSTQVMSFGSLSTLYRGLEVQDRAAIALDFDVLSRVPDGDAAALGSWLNHIRHVRNLCAHHSRVWNRNFDVTLGEVAGMAELAEIKGKSARRIYGTIAAMRFLLARSDPANTWGVDTIRFIEAEAARVGLDLDAMGFPATWKDSPLWDAGYAPNADTRARMQTVDRLETASTTEMARLLRADSPDQAKGRLNYLRKKNAVIGLQILHGSTHRYPTFQLDAATQDFYPVVMSANRKLFVRNNGASKEEHHWLALEWWMSPEPLLDDMSPLDALAAGCLDQIALDRALPGPED
ncbi:Abi family protein [Salinibacterium hongtaonis]|nr:Abi family protein [Salinibacterium hongtaonis]